MRWLWAFLLCLAPLLAWPACPDPVPPDAICLRWTAPTHNVDGSVLTDLAGFRIYWGPSSRGYAEMQGVPDASQTEELIYPGPGDWYIAMTAFDADGNESGFSNEIVRAPAGSVVEIPGAVTLAATWSWEEQSTGSLSVSAENISAARADPITRQITVPPGTTTAVALIAYYPARNVVSASLGGAPPHAQSILPNNDSMGFLVWNSPPAGPQSLVIDYSGGISAGTTAHMIYVTGAKPYSGKYAQGVVAGAGQAVATISGIAPSWLVIRFESLYNQGVPVLADGWTDLGVTGPDATLYGRASFRFAGGDSVTARTANVAYPTLQILAFEPL